MVQTKVSYTSRVTGQRKVFKSYICSKHSRTGGSACSRHHISERVLLEIVRADIKSHLERIDIDEEQLLRDIQKRLNIGSLEEARGQCERLATRLIELESIGVKLYEDRAKGIINVGTFTSLFEKIEAERAELNAEQERISGLLHDFEHRASDANQIIPLLKGFISLEAVTRITLAELLDVVVVCEPTGSGKSRRHDVKIVYRFGM